MSINLDIDKVVGHKTLIIGEAGTGKTRLLASVVDEFITRGLTSKITIIDMAPSRTYGIGGRMADYDSLIKSKVRYFYSDEIRPPRLLAKTSEEAMRIAIKNSKIIDELLDKYLSDPTEILVINDVTIYAHAGDTEKLTEIIMYPKTFVGTAYEGKKISEDWGSGITMREKQYIAKLLKIIDNVVRLS